MLHSVAAQIKQIAVKKKGGKKPFLPSLLSSPNLVSQHQETRNCSCFSLTDLRISVFPSLVACGRIFLNRKLSRIPRVSLQFSVEKIMHSLRGLSDKFPPTLGPMIQ